MRKLIVGAGIWGAGGGGGGSSTTGAGAGITFFLHPVPETNKDTRTSVKTTSG
jgi:hypothetical protein